MGALVAGITFTCYNRNMIELICMGCGTTFSRNIHQHNANIRRGRTIIACSNRCVNTARFKDHDSTIHAKCIGCGEDFSRKRHSNDKMLYCSVQCSGRNNGSHNRPRQIRRCRVCNTAVVTNRRRVCDDCKVTQRYSSRPDWSAITLQELRDRYSISQYHAKLRGMSRSEYKRHDKAMSCKVDGYSLHVDICHIRDVRDFPMTAAVSEVNHIDNLVALCKRCHWEFDNGYLELD